MKIAIISSCSLPVPAVNGGAVESLIESIIRQNIPKQEIWKFYALGDLAILPSMWEEPLGLTMIEAQAAGIPLITTISGGIPETVNEKYSILLARNTQIVEKMQGAMEEILNNLNAWKGKAQLAQQEVNQKYDECSSTQKCGTSLVLLRPMRRNPRICLQNASILMKSLAARV